MPVDEEQYFFMSRGFAFRQERQQGKDFLPVLEVAASDFANNEIMAGGDIPFEEFGEMTIAGTQMVDPGRGID